MNKLIPILTLLLIRFSIAQFAIVKCVRYLYSSGQLDLRLLNDFEPMAFLFLFIMSFLPLSNIKELKRANDLKEKELIVQIQHLEFLKKLAENKENK